MEKVFYQPIMPPEEFVKSGLPSFGVYRSYHKCKEDFPECTIGAFTEDEIEEPTFMDGDLSMSSEVELKPEDGVMISANNILINIKYNDIGISVDYYPNVPEPETPFREDQVWWDDVPNKEEDDKS